MTRSVVLLSGGLDSATALAIARARGDECHTLAFDYGQRHRAELVAARRVSGALGAFSHREARVPLAEFGGSALTDKRIAVPERGGPGIPVTYVPARNTVFLSLGLALAGGHADKIVSAERDRLLLIDAGRRHRCFPGARAARAKTRHEAAATNRSPVINCRKRTSFARLELASTIS